jgi:cellulose synthase/poly-beta-1,6-N-acetylglucosamine synthase-like glycosyltransferase
MTQLRSTDAEDETRLIEPLPDQLSARRLVSRGQAVAGAVIGGCAVAVVVARLAAGVGPSPLWWAQAAVAAVTAAYVLVIAFKFTLVLAAHAAPVLRPGADECYAVADSELADYTILVPLYREERVAAALVAKLSLLDYPQERLQVLLLVEEDDGPTRQALDGMDLGSQFEVVLIPPSLPRTKPKACNVGLQRARGEYCVIYDAEDRPAPDQLRKAAAAFRSLPDWVVCVQAELQYWNPDTNWLTRCFAAEYALNFSLFLRGLDRFALPIPLGGTSNHFRTDALARLGGWDPYNVTEDADLGIRIARRGWGVRVMTSVTEEEANSALGNWLRQRSRWIKGYYQTWLVHMRSPWRLWRELGTRRFLSLQATLGMATFTTLVNPAFWALTVVYLVEGPGPIAPLFPMPVLYLGVAAMLAGNFLMVYSLMMACMERGLSWAMRSILAVPVYWGLMSAAAYKALFQLLNPARRHYWELTQHGLVTEQNRTEQNRAPGARRVRAPVTAPAYAAAIATLCLVAALTVVLVTGVLPGLRSSRSSRAAATDSGSAAAAVAAASRTRAASWIATQASHSANVACDPAMCSAIEARGFPAGHLDILEPSSNDPAASTIVVATSAVRRQFGRRLDQVGAPVIMASFGARAARIDIQASVAGTAGYAGALRTDLPARRQAGRQLLRNSRLTVAAAGRRELAAGQVDSRLLMTLAALTSARPVEVLAFGADGPGASAGVPLRSAQLAPVGTGASGRSYLQWLAAFLNQQRTPFRAARVSMIQAAGGTVIEVEFSAPAPLGLLATRP